MPFLVEVPPFPLVLCTEKEIKDMMDQMKILQPLFTKKLKVPTENNEELEDIMKAAKREKEKADEVPKLVAKKVVTGDDGKEHEEEVFSKFYCYC